MAEQTGGGDAPATITITEGGVTCEVRPLGFRDFWTLEGDLLAVRSMPDDDVPAIEAACRSIADRMDRYHVSGSLPSEVLPRHLRAFIRRWAMEVRDAAVPPPSGAA